MTHQDMLKEMQESIGTKDPIVYFSKMTELFSVLFNKIDKLEKTLEQYKCQSALAIQWEPKLALSMLSKEVMRLRALDKEMYATEISGLKHAYAEDRVTQSYQEFCQFWEDTLGWHPFLDYR